MNRQAYRRPGPTRASAMSTYWPVIMALSVALILLLAGRRAITGLPHGNAVVERSRDATRIDTQKKSTTSHTASATGGGDGTSSTDAAKGSETTKKQASNTGTTKSSSSSTTTTTAAAATKAKETKSSSLLNQRISTKEEDTDLDGDQVIAYGSSNKEPTADKCSESCIAHDRCNVWVYCGKKEGCGGGGGDDDAANYKECWLKSVPNVDLIHPRGRRGPTVGWVSGVVATQQKYESARASAEAVAKKEADRLAGLKANQSLPLVYFDVEIKGKPVGRIEMVLFTDASPRCAENFRRFVTGEAGATPPTAQEGPGVSRHFKGAFFYRIIDQFIDQTGVETASAINDAQFKDDAGGLALRHEHKGILSMANMGPDTNTNHFSIMMGPSPHLDGHYTIFGQVVSGLEVVDEVNRLSVGKQDNTATREDGAQIVDCGQIRKGTIVPKLDL